MDQLLHIVRVMCARLIATLCGICAIGCAGNLPAEVPTDEDVAFDVLPDGSVVETDPDDDRGPSDRPEPTYCDTFEPSSVATVGTKLKTLLTGDALNPTELAVLEGSFDRQTLKDFIDVWIRTPQGQAKLQDFFATSFQQTGVGRAEFFDQFAASQIPMGIFKDGPGVQNTMIQQFEESFARTVMHMIEQGRPFHEVNTTRSFMMTSAMMFLLAYHDDRAVDDKRNYKHRRYGQQIEKANVEVRRNSAIPLRQSLNPASANFMVFSIPDLDPCFPSPTRYGGNTMPFMRLMFGNVQQRSGCSAKNRPPLLPERMFNDWRMVTVRRPQSGEAPTSYLDPFAIEGSDELVVSTRRVGFFTTPAFFSLWQTNVDNDARVTANQTLITALGAAFDGDDVTIPVTEEALDGEHADPTTACYGCHKTLDPMRQFFRREYSIHYGTQRDATVRETPGAFSFGGVAGTGDTIYDLGAFLAESETFAPAWAQKLCTYANSTACPQNSEEFKAAVQAFEDDNQNFYTLARELFSSTLITNAECLEGNSADMPSMARRGHLCSMLSARLDQPDICGLEEPDNRTRSVLQRSIIAGALIVPDDAFSRGDADPVLISDTSMFSTGALEITCARLATRMVGTGEQPYHPSEYVSLIRMWTERLMGLPAGDPRHEGALEILYDHWDAAKAEGTDDVTALRSVMMLACMSPTSTAIGL